MRDREEKFEEMLAAVLANYQEINHKMERLKAEGKNKSATYRQLMGNKLMYQQMLSLYQFFGLIEKNKGGK